MNKAWLIGNLTRDVESKALENGTKVCSFSIATNEIKDKVEYHNIVSFNKTAEICEKYLSKGKKVAIDGRIQTRSWEGQDGKKNYRTEIIANSVEFLSPKEPANQGDYNSPSNADEIAF